MAGLPKNKPEDAWKFVKIRGNDECWPWLGTMSGRYGQIRVNNNYYRAHRLIYWLSKGDIELKTTRDNYIKQFVLHTCDNTLCCNPAHLYVGNIWDNMRDKVERGRQFRARGEIHVKAKLTNADAERVRESSLFGARYADLANIYGVHRGVIENIVHRKTYFG